MGFARFICLISLVFSGISNSWGATNSARQPCPPEAFAKFAKNTKVKFPNKLSALRQEFPHLEDPENFAELYRQRLEDWRLRHPGQLPNVPLLEHKPAVDWLRALLSDLSTNPHYRYPDEATRRLTENARVVQTAEFLERAKAIEAQGYPTRDVTALADNVFDFLRRIDSDPPEVDKILRHLTDNKDFPYKVNVPMAERFRLETLRSAPHRESVVGERRLSMYETYFQELAIAIKKHSEPKPSELEVANIIRQYQFREGFSPSPYTIAERAVASTALDGDRPILFSTRETPVRALVEATLFKINIAGLVDEPVMADFALMSPEMFLDHDFRHITDAAKAKIPTKIIEWSSSKKHLLLNKIDAIKDPREKQIREHVVLVALRESLGNRTNLFSSQYPENEWISMLQFDFEVLGGPNLTEVEAKSAIEWWKKNLPTR